MNKTISLPFYICNRCNHKWIPRSIKIPKVCPNCNSPYWNKERRKKIMKKPKKEKENIGDLTELSSDINSCN